MSDVTSSVKSTEHCGSSNCEPRKLVIEVTSVFVELLQFNLQPKKSAIRVTSIRGVVSVGDSR